MIPVHTFERADTVEAYRSHSCCSPLRSGKNDRKVPQLCEDVETTAAASETLPSVDNTGHCCDRSPRGAGRLGSDWISSKFQKVLGQGGAVPPHALVRASNPLGSLPKTREKQYRVSTEEMDCMTVLSYTNRISDMLFTSSRTLNRTLWIRCYSNIFGKEVCDVKSRRRSQEVLLIASRF